MRKILVLISAFCLLAPAVSPAQPGEPYGGTDLKGLMPGLPVGGGAEEADLDLCPRGANVIGAFMAAWRKGDYEQMYRLLDDDSKKDYPYEEARFDLMMMKFKDYRIGSIRQDGDNFVFILNYGDYKYGDKDTLKALISGRSFKIIPHSRGQVFKRSAENYF